MKRALVLMIAVVLAIGLFLVGCKPEAIVITETETVTETVEVEVPAKPFEGQTVTVWRWPDDSGIVAELFNEFTEKTGIIVNHEEMTLDWGEYVTQTVTYLSQGYEDIDVYWMPEVSTPSYMAAGWLEPLDDYFSTEDLSDWSKDYLAVACQYEGKTYHVPQTLGLMCLYYDQAAFDEAGVEVPEKGWTWDDLVAIGKALTTDDRHGIILTGAPGGYLFNDINHFVSQNGGDLSDFNDPKTQEALKFYYDLIWTHEIAPPETPQNGYLEGVEVFLQGKGAMLFTWDSVKGIIEERFPDSFKNKDYWALPMFSGPAKDYVMASNWGWAVGSSSANKALGKEFIKFMTSPEAMIKYSPLALPPRASLLADPGQLTDPIIAEMDELNIAVSATRQFYSAVQSEFETAVSDAVHAYITNQITFDEMIAQAVETIGQLE